MGFKAGTGTLLMIIKWSYTTSEEFITSLNISWSMILDGVFVLFCFGAQLSCNRSFGETIKKDGHYLVFNKGTNLNVDMKW